MLPYRGWHRDGSRRSLLRPKPIIIGFGVLIMLLVCVGAGLAIRELRLRRDINDEKRELTALDLLLARRKQNGPCRASISFSPACSKIWLSTA